MNLNHLLAELAQRGVQLWADGNQLRIRAPKGAINAAQRKALREHKSQLLLLLRQNSLTSAHDLPQIVPAPSQRYEPFPLTDLQQAYWVGRSGIFEGGEVSAHGYFEFEGRDLDLMRLSAAWQALIERHDMLRAVILPTGQQQILKQVPPYEMKVLDLREHSPTVVSSQLLAIRDEMSHQVLPSDQWPLFEIRATCFEDRVRLHFSLDLLISDFSSLYRLFQEWGQLYRNPLTRLAPLDLSVRDYVLAELALQETDLYQHSQAYWFKRLDSLPPAPQLPLAVNPASLTQPRYKNRHFELDATDWTRLTERATEAGLSPSGLLLAAFAEVLAVWGESPSFTINLTRYNRLPLHPQVNEIIGNTVSVTLLAVVHSNGNTFLERASRLQQQLWQDLEHQYISGVRVLRELGRRQGRNQGAIMPIVFTSILGLSSFGIDASALEQFGEIVYDISQTPQVWLDHQVTEQEGRLLINWDTVDALFPEGLVDDMFGAYCHFLQELARSEQAWSTTPQLVPPAQLALRAAINQTSAPVPPGQLHTLFSHHANSHPHQLAIISPRRTLTYGELEQQSNQVAHHLRQLGVERHSLVPIVMQKGWQQIVAVFGILKTGAAYTPIDANWPVERIRLLIHDSEADVVLTQASFKETINWPQHLSVVCVDFDTVAAMSSAPLLDTVGQEPSDLAYVLYTSGSTGKPKGVMIEHRHVINRMSDIAQRFALKPSDRAIALTALHHDLSIFDIFCMLSIVGGGIVMPDAAFTREPAHWAQLMNDEQVTLWNSVPAFMQMIVEYLEHAPWDVPEQLRWVILSGDFIPVDLPDRLRSLCPQVEIISSGGPTETTVWDIFYPIGDVNPAWKSIPYGKPLSNAQYYVLNEKLEPRPTWVPGELYIGGVGLARGYWHDEERTQASFITHPQSGQRLYRSGDMGRYLPDGNIEILGRKDFQIKIRGHRIEAGEVEATLNRHPAVKRAIVTATQERHNKQLVAYIVPSEESSPPQPSDTDDDTARLGEVITDPVERVEFKLKKLGFRRLDEREYGERISLLPTDLDDQRARAYTERQSYRTYSQESISFAHLSQLLSSLSPVQLANSPLAKYLYGSAGGLYPVQTYLHIKPNRIEGIAGGTYYYHPGEGTLILLTPDRGQMGLLALHVPTNQAIFESAAFSLFLVGKMSAIKPMYGSLSRDFCLLEAGYMSQLLMMSAPKSQLGLCPIGDIKHEGFYSLLQLDHDDHVLLHSLVGGGISEQQKSHIATPQTAVAQTQAELTQELRHYLQSQLPDYMVPKHVVWLEQLPLTPNGKVDRKSLPLPDTEMAAEETIAPNSEVEQRLSGILQEVLGIAAVSVTKNFFDIGANSLHLVQIYNKLQHIYANVTVTDIFRHPSIRALAQYLGHPEPLAQASQEVEERQQRGQTRRAMQKRRGRGRRRRS